MARSAAQAPAGIGLYPSETIRDLPAGANLFGLFETAQPDVVADRFNGGGLNVSEPSRVSAFLASWSQTRYRVGAVPISSPVDGTPMLFPESAWWSAATAHTGATAVESPAAGLTVAFDPHRAGSQWTRTIEVIGSGGAGTPGESKAPPIVRLDDWAHVSALAAGPLMNGRLGIAAGGAWTGAHSFERGGAARDRDRLGSAFAHAVFALSTTRALQTLGWVQSSRAPFALGDRRAPPEAGTGRRAFHLQSSLADSRWRGFGAFTQRSTTHEHEPAGQLEIDRLVHGPVPVLVDSEDTVERLVTAGARLSPAFRFRGHSITIGGDLHVASSTKQPSFSGTIVERVDGIAARVWRYASAGLESHRRATTIAAFAHDRIAVSPQLSLEAAVRFDSVDAGARGASGEIDWRTWLPFARLNWDLGTSLGLRFFSSAGLTANQPMLGLLAYGDPAAPTAQVLRWQGSVQASTTLVARAGPGSGGDPSFSRIDPKLKRPVTGEFAIGLESRPRPALELSVTGFARRQSSLIAVVNSGVPASSYSTFTIPDANADLVGPADDQLLVVYNRAPESFGQDQYVLTNPDLDAATMGAFVVAAKVATDRLFMQIGGTASASVGPGGNRGFRAFENDQDMVGEVSADPNASTYARGRLFNDRAFTIKWTTVYRFPADIRAGIIARYQDGQPFSRMVVVPELNQGADAIQAFANGRSRFAFTGTLDVRLQKGFTAAAARFDVLLDIYNALNMKKEVEEYVVTGPRFRATTAVQPPRAIHLGARVRF